jgi:hypothetical protein
MSDNKNERNSPDSRLISLRENYEVEYWTKKFNITPDQLKQAVNAAGDSAAAVERWLRDNNISRG